MGNTEIRYYTGSNGGEEGWKFIPVLIRVQTSQEKFKPLALMLSLPAGLISIYDKNFLLIWYFELGFLILAKINFINL